MEKPKQVTDLDLGETLIIEGSKVHVNIDKTTIVAENGVLRAVLPTDSPITQFKLSQTGTLTLGVRGVAQPYTVDLTGLVPASQADRFLSGVTFDQTEKAFVFTTSKDGEEDLTFKVPLADFLQEVVKISAEDGNILELREDGLYVACCSGNGVGLGEVPEKPFEVGSKVLAYDSQGSLYKFAESSAYHKDVSVTVDVTENTILDDGYNTAKVIVRVANNLGTQADDVTLNVGSSAEVSGANTNVSGLSLAPRSSQTFEYAVRYNTSGYFTATVNATGDTVSSNNTASVALPYNTTRVSNAQTNTYTEECPIVVATYNGEVLAPSRQTDSVISISGSYTRYDISPNVIVEMGVRNLAGKKITFQGASRVEVYFWGQDLNEDERLDKLIVTRNGNEYTSSVYHYNSLDYIKQTDKFTFDVDTGVFTFNSDFTENIAVISVRPGGNNCKWQHYVVACDTTTSTLTENDFELANTEYNVGVEYEVTETNPKLHKPFDELDAFNESTFNGKILGTLGSDPKLIDSDNYGYWVNETLAIFHKDSTVNRNKRLVIKHCQGQEATFTVTLKQGTLPATQGNITIRNLGDNNYEVSIKATATATDNVITDEVKLVVVEC